MFSWLMMTFAQKVGCDACYNWPSRSKVYSWTIDYIHSIYIYIFPFICARLLASKPFYVIYIQYRRDHGLGSTINTCPHIPAHKYPIFPFLLSIYWFSIVTFYSYRAVPATTSASIWQNVDTFTLSSIRDRDVYYSIKYCI